MRALLAWLRQGRRKLMTAWFVLRDARTPRRVRLLILAAMTYAVSPIDLIPDITPVLGYLDDAVLVPLGLAFALRLSPRDVVMAAEMQADRVRAWVIGVALLLFIAFWAGMIWLFIHFVFHS